MQTLDKTLRNRLESTIKIARDTAESAALAALEQLGVGDAKASDFLDDNQRDLRRRLRVHGRQLGDVRNSQTETQELDWLIEEIAYEHWHRMLFARFLAENDLLMYPDPDDPVSISLEECEDLATEEGAENGWELAARYAARMLPRIFRPDSPSFELALPPEYQSKLEQLLSGLDPEVFTASDSLGWVYQFWQAKRKETVNASGVNIGARELPAVTQLFTEDYMVSFLLDNSLGAWWAAKRLNDIDLQTAASEAELRDKAAIPGVTLEYLRFVQLEDGSWTPAAGTFDAWPEHLSELKTLDPCCGSGHFLVAAFLMLVPMRMELENLSSRDAVDAVLRENINGLELDQRCVELAAFALAFTAWKYPDAGGYRPLPELSVACSGLSVSGAKEEWKKLGLGKRNLTMALDWLHSSFKDAPILGSLLNPAKTDAAKIIEWGELSTTLTQALQQEQTDEQQEAAVVAHGLSKAAALLARQYNWVITNVPYLGRGKQHECLRDFCDKHYPAAKSDLATVFLDRCLELCLDGGTSSIVLPQNWLFLASYKKFREKLLKHDVWHLIARLGPGAFETISGEVVKAILINISKGGADADIGGLFGEIETENILRGVDVSEPRTAGEKATQLIATEVKSIAQAKQLKNPDAVVVFENLSSKSFLKDYAHSYQGIKTGDDLRFRRLQWEVNDFCRWHFTHGGPFSIGLTGHCYCLDWKNDGKDFARLQGLSALKNNGISLTTVGKIYSQDYYGFPFSSELAAIIPNNRDLLIPIKVYAESVEFERNVKKIDQNLAVSTSSLVKVPFDLQYWTKVAEKKYPNGLPEPFSDDPTQWIFHGHPCGSVVWDNDTKWTAHESLRIDDTVMQIAVARLLGYRWPAELDTDMELAAEQRELVSRCDKLLPLADEDGIVCIPPVRDELSASDRLLNLLAAAYGEAWSNDTLSQLLNSVGHSGKSLDSWLRDKFFPQHFKLFGNRPFIWHIWDGLPDGFAALVNYHKLDRRNLETLIYTYLGDWITRRKQDVTSGIDGSKEKLDAAEALKKRLELILEGQDPYDIFVRWKPIEQQAIGWTPDLNDGIRMNIRPFMSVPDINKRGAGILRDKPNIKWTKDRGKDVVTAPWYNLGPIYGGKEGDRINNHHLKLEDKQAAKIDKEEK